MANQLEPEGYGLKIYDRFPEMYRIDDIDTKYALKRFLNTCGEGGFRYIIEDANRMLDLYDTDKVSLDILPHLFKSYGFEIFNGLPETYLRRLAGSLSYLYKRKGTLDVIEYLSGLVSGVKSTIEVVDPSQDPEHFPDADIQRLGVLIHLEFDYDMGVKDLPDDKQIKRIIKEFIPFYCIVSVVFQYVHYDECRFAIRDSSRSEFVRDGLSYTFGDAVFGQSVFNDSGNTVGYRVTDEHEDSIVVNEPIGFSLMDYFTDEFLEAHSEDGSLNIRRSTNQKMNSGLGDVLGYATIGNTTIGGTEVAKTDADEYYIDLEEEE